VVEDLIADAKVILPKLGPALPAPKREAAPQESKGKKKVKGIGAKALDKHKESMKGYKEVLDMIFSHLIR